MRKSGLANNAFHFPAQINPDADLVLRTLRSATAVPVAELAQQPVGTIVKVRALALAGPDGTVTARHSGTPCVWYRCSFIPVPAFGSAASFLPDFGSSDVPAMQGLGIGQIRERMNASEEISTRPFAVGEAGGPLLLVDPHVADVDIAAPTLSRWWRGARLSRAYEIEWLLPAGTPVLVVGRVGADGRLTADDDAALLISTRDEDAVLERCRHEQGRHQMDARTNKLRRFDVRVRHVTRTFLVALVVVFVIFVLATTFL